MCYAILNWKFGFNVKERQVSCLSFKNYQWVIQGENIEKQFVNDLIEIIHNNELYTSKKAIEKFSIKSLYKFK